MLLYVSCFSCLYSVPISYSCPYPTCILLFQEEPVGASMETEDLAIPVGDFLGNRPGVLSDQEEGCDGKVPEHDHGGGGAALDELWKAEQSKVRHPWVGGRG